MTCHSCLRGPGGPVCTRGQDCTEREHGDVTTTPKVPHRDSLVAALKQLTGWRSEPATCDSCDHWSEDNGDGPPLCALNPTLSFFSPAHATCGSHKEK